MNHIIYVCSKKTPLKHQYLKFPRVQFLETKQQQLSYFRLFIEKLPAHPDYKSLGASKEKTNNKQVCINVVFLKKLYQKNLYCFMICLYAHCFIIILYVYLQSQARTHPPVKITCVCHFKKVMIQTNSF